MGAKSATGAALNLLISMSGGPTRLRESRLAAAVQPLLWSGTRMFVVTFAVRYTILVWTVVGPPKVSVPSLVRLDFGGAT